MSASRRDFLRWGAIGGAALVIPLPLLGKPDASGSAVPFAPNQWLRVGADGKVKLVVARSEMGQGVRTCLAMILADELEADWSSISIEQASPSPLYEDMSTGGSDSVESSWMVLRRAAAAAREMLVTAAAGQWKAKPGDCRAENGSVVHVASRKRLSYGSLARAAASLPVPKEPTLKDPKDFRLIGTRVRRIDGPDIVTGRARYGLDTRPGDALFAAIARCPVAGGRARRFDAAKAKAVPGVVQVIEVSAGIAVVARDSFAALSGRDALAIDWDEGPNAALTTAELLRRLDAAAAGAARVSRRRRRRGQGARRRSRANRGHLARRVPGPRHGRAPERLREGLGRLLRDLGAHAEPAAGPEGDGEAPRNPAGEGHRPRHADRRRVRAAPGRRLRDRGGRGRARRRQAGAGRLVPAR